MVWIFIAVIALQPHILLDDRFDAREATRLEVDIARGDVVLHTEPGTREVRVRLLGSGDDWEDIDRVYRELDFDVYVEDGAVVVRSREPERGWRFWEWLRERRVRFELQVTIPEDYEVSVSTRGGDIEGAIHRADTRLRTLGGDIRFTEITAPEEARVHTSGGDIEGDVVRARGVEVRTLGGDITLGVVEGELLEVQTSGGDISIERFSGKGRVATLGGDIEILLVEGDLEATTSGGDISVWLLKPGTVSLRTLGGDIAIWMPEELPAEIDFRGERVRISSAFTFTGELTTRHATGMLNGGGDVRLEARTSGGSITLRPLAKE